MQNCYPIAMEPLDMRNERGFDGLGRVGGIGRERGVWATLACWPAGVAWEGRGRCGRRAARVNWRLQRESESITRRVQRPAPSGPSQGRLVQAVRWSPARSLWVAGLDGGSVARSGRLRAIRAAYLRTGVLSTVYTAPVLARAGTGGGEWYLKTGQNSGSASPLVTSGLIRSG